MQSLICHGYGKVLTNSIKNLLLHVTQLAATNVSRHKNIVSEEKTKYTKRTLTLINYVHTKTPSRHYVVSKKCRTLQP